MRSKYSVQEHQKVGITVRKLRHQLIELSVDLARAFGKTHKLHRMLQSTLRAVEKAQCELDDEFYRAGGEGNSPYYGRPDAD